MPRATSCWMAAARRRSAAIRRERCPCWCNWRASLAAVVVLPDPWRPTSNTTLGGRPDWTILWSPPLRTVVSSSLTIFTTCWPGLRLSMTSLPTALSLTRLTRSLATLKLTSASSMARRTCLSASSTSFSDRRPLPVIRWNIPLSLSVSDSNIRQPP